MRDNSVSISKAIAIILMVLAHSGFSEYGNYWINMFHMPLFFFMAGYCFKDKYLSDCKEYICRRIKGIYIPFVKWATVFLLLHNVFYGLNIYNDTFGFRGNVSHLYTLQEFVLNEVYIITKMGGAEQLLGGYWFLSTLLWASVIGYITIKECKKMSIGGMALISLTIIISFFNRHVPYFGIGARDFFASTFFFAGYVFKNINIGIYRYRWYLIMVAPVLITIGMKYWQANLLNFEWFEVIPYFFTAIVGTLAVFMVSIVIVQKTDVIKKSLTYIGDNTLTILTWHMLSFKLISLLIIVLYSLPIERLAEFPTIEEYAQQGWFVPYTIIGIVIPLIFSKNKYLK